MEGGEGKRRVWEGRRRGEGRERDGSFLPVLLIFPGCMGARIVSAYGPLRPNVMSSI